MRLENEVEEMEKELRMQFGPLPDALVNLLEAGRAKIRAQGLGIREI